MPEIDLSTSQVLLLTCSAYLVVAVFAAGVLVGVGFDSNPPHLELLVLISLLWPLLLAGLLLVVLIIYGRSAFSTTSRWLKIPALQVLYWLLYPATQLFMLGSWVGAVTENCLWEDSNE